MSGLLSLRSSHTALVDSLREERASALMQAMGYEPSTAGVAAAYPFADAFVLDATDATELDRPTVRTDISIETPDDAARVRAAVERAVTATQ